MTAGISQFTARSPRHLATRRSDIEVTVRDAKNTREPARAELRDLSRQGAQVRLAHELPVGQPIVLDIFCKTTQFELSLRAVACWNEASPDGGWLAGCRFQSEIEWATFGEMFLNGILDAAGYSPGAVRLADNI